MDTETKGLSLWMAVIFLAGQMAGVGVLALPSAMVGTGRFVRVENMDDGKNITGPAGFFLLIYFTYNAIFVGQRLGLCWMMIEEQSPELKEGVSIYACLLIGLHFVILSVEIRTWLLRKNLLVQLEGILFPYACHLPSMVSVAWLSS